MKKFINNCCKVLVGLCALAMFIGAMAVIWLPDTGFSFYPQLFCTGLITALFACFGGAVTCS